MRNWDACQLGWQCRGFESRLPEHQQGVAQSGRAPALGAGGRRFESCHPDHEGSFCEPETLHNVL